MHLFSDVNKYNLEEDEKAGCSVILVVGMYSCCGFSVALPHGAVGWSAVCDCGIPSLHSLTF